MNRGKRGKRGRNNGDDYDVKVSKKLSWVLRHGAVKCGLAIDSAGYVKIDDLLQNQRFAHLNLAIIQDVVAKNDKQRFKIEEFNGELYIRANQGHTLQEIDDNALCRKVLDPSEIPLVVHGTQERFISNILEVGLDKMRRNHIHFAQGYPGDSQVISGVRLSCDAFIEIDVEKAMQDGIEFFVSDNGVVLSSGFNGVIYKQYFKKITVHGKDYPFLC